MTKFSTCVVIAAVLTVPPATAEAKAYKGAEVYSIATVLYGRMEMRMRMIRGSGLISTFFTYKNGSEVAGTAWEETDVEALGKNDGTSWQSNLKTGNPPVTSEQLYTTTTSLADAYHTYAVEWTPDYVAWSFDGAMVRKTDGGQASSLTNGETLRFNAWASDATGWAGTLDASALPAYQFVNWIKYYRYDNGQFVLDWTDDFDSFDKTRWSAGNWTFDGNLVDFDPANAVVQDGTLILAITKEGETGFTSTVPPDDGTTDPGDGGVVISNPHSDSGCAIGGARANGAGLCAMLLAIGFAVYRRRRRTVILAALVVGVLAPSTASATQGAELLKSQAYFYGRFEARIRFAPGEGVVSSFFLWKDGSDTAASWNELDFEKINSDCRLQTNVWSGKGNQSATINTPSFNICNDYHTYAFEWTPDYISWLIDGTQIRRVTGAVVTEYAQNATQGMTFHFNLWAGNSTFGGNLSASTLPVNEYISWVQYSSYSNSAFQVQWREDFNASGTMPPTGWSEGTWASPFNLSTHNPANVNFTNGIAVLSMTADNATGLSGPPPADPAGGTGGTSGTGGTTGAAGRGGAGGSGGTTGSAGRGGTGGSSAPGAGGTSSGGRGGATGTGGAAGNGAGGIPAGTGGNTGAGGIAGTGAEGGTTGAAGDGAGGNAAGAAGTGISGASGTGGTSSVGSGGAMASGGSTGSAGTGSAGTSGAGDAPGSGGGCGCLAAGEGSSRGGGLVAALLIAAAGVRRRRRGS